MGRWLNANRNKRRTAPTIQDVAPDTLNVDSQGRAVFNVGANAGMNYQAEALKRGYGPLNQAEAAKRVGKDVEERRWRVLTKEPGVPEKSNIVVDTLRAIPRAIASPLVSVLSGGKGTEYQPKSPAARFLLGDEPVYSPGKRIERAATTIQGITKDTKSPFPYVTAALGVAGSTILDTLFEGRASTAKAATESILKKIISQTGRELDEDLVRSVAREATEAFTKKGAARNTAIRDVERKYLTLSSPPPTGPFDAGAYVKEMAEQQSKARNPFLRLTDRVKQVYQEAKSNLVDSNAPIEDVLRTAERKGKFQVLPERHITNQIDRVLRAPTLAGQFARDNGIEKIIKEVPDLNALDQYMIAKQAQAVEGRGLKTGRDLVRDRQLIAVLHDQYEPYATAVTDYSQKILDYAVDSGLISADLASTLKSIYPDYVPLNRVFSEVEQAAKGNTKAVASLSKQTVVERFTGASEDAIESPLTSILEKTNDAFRQGEKNKAAKMLADYRDLPGNPFQIRELGKNEGAEHTISFLDNGVKRTFATTREVSDAAKAMSVQQINILGRIFALPVRIAKLGITGINLPFVGANVARDQLFTAVTSNNTLRTSIANPVVFVKSLFSALGHDELYQQMVRAGAGGTSFDIARNQAAPTIARIRAGRSKAGKILYTVTHPGELLRTVEDIIGRSEEFTRLTQFKGTRDAMVAKGMTAERATIEAAKAARENSANFARRGNWGTVLNSAFLYLNASIQGSRSLIRAFGRSPGKTAMKVGGFLFFPMAVMTAWNLGDERRKEVYADIPDYEKQNNFIIVPPNPTQDEKGRWNVIKIPLPPGAGNLTVPVRRSMEMAAGLDPVKFGEIANALIGTVSPINPDKGSILSTLTPQALKPTLEGATNTNFFTGLPQVPQSMEDLSPELQAKETTSGTARLIAKGIGGSPIKVEEFIKGTLGGVGSQALNISDRALAGMDIIPRDQIGGQDIVDAVLARFAKARGGASEDKQNEKLKAVLTNQADDRFLAKQEAEMLYDELSTLPAAEANAKATELKTRNPAVYAKLKDIAQAKQRGLTYSDRLIGQLGVDNGERAKFIWAEVQSLKTTKEKNTYVEELRRKKLVTDQVLKQLRYLASL